MGGEKWVDAALSDTHRIAGGKEDETWTRQQNLGRILPHPLLFVKLELKGCGFKGLRTTRQAPSSKTAPLCRIRKECGTQNPSNLVATRPDYHSPFVRFLLKLVYSACYLSQLSVPRKVGIEIMLQATPGPGSHEPWLSIIGGGLAAAIVTIIFNVVWDSRKQKMAEDWEFKRYEANQIHFATAGIMEAYFSAKAEMYYLTSSLASLLATLNQLTAQADQIVRQQGGPELTVAVLEQRKQTLLQPFQKFNSEQVNLRWNQYEQKAKENHTKAEIHLAALKFLIPPALHVNLVGLFEKLAAPFPWNLDGGKEKLATLEAAQADVLAFREKLMTELERKLGR